MQIFTKRAYKPVSNQDGYRILVDRLWPRGLSKERIKIDEWLKDVAPSEELRKSFHLEEISWEEFEREYLIELEKHKDRLKSLIKFHQKENITLLFSSKDEEKNNATVLKKYLETLEYDN